MELNTLREEVLCHYKGKELIGITHINGRHTLLKVREMSRKDTEDFYETNKTNNEERNKSAE